jgi:hypothetical protein
MFAKNNNLSHPPTCIVHLGLVLQDARQFIPLTILARRDEGLACCSSEGNAYRLTPRSGASSKFLLLLETEDVGDQVI